MISDPEDFLYGVVEGNGDRLFFIETGNQRTPLKLHIRRSVDGVITQMLIPYSAVAGIAQAFTAWVAEHPFETMRSQTAQSYTLRATLRATLPADTPPEDPNQ